MGLCMTKNDKGDKKAAKNAPQNVQNINQLTVNKADFIHSNVGNFRDIYSIGAMLGQGAFGEVRKCVHRQTKVARAVKIIRRDSMTKEEEESFKYEIGILKKLDHPNILKLYEVFQDDKRYFIVTELCKGGELFDEIVSQVQFSEQKAATIIQQILQAVAYCHELNIVHRDLKPENVLIDKEMNNILKIIDFGTSTEIQITNNKKQVLKTTHGTSYYIAPEVLKKEYNEKCDVWSIGVILYILLSGKPPFDGEDDDKITKKVAKGKYDITEGSWKAISEEAKSLIKKMLDVDYSRRISAKDALADNWFKQAKDTVVDADVMKESLKNLTKFRATQKLQQATMSMMVQNMVTKEETAKLQQVFQKLDENKDGKLQYNELLKGFEEYYGDAAKDEVDRIFALVDVDQSGEIDFSEFVTATVNRNNLLQEDKLKLAFQYYDTDNSGEITVEEIKEALGVGKGNIDENVWKQVAQEVDVNGDGLISYEEFKEMMLKLLK